ncbi:MAG: helix-turn-helix transcriptional regulator [Myxococcales bacterium]
MLNENVGPTRPLQLHGRPVEPEPSLDAAQALAAANRRGAAVVKNVVERCGATGAAMLFLRSGIVGASDAAVHGSAGDRCLATFARRSLPLPEAPADGGCTAMSVAWGTEGISRLWIAAAYDREARPTAVLAAAFQKTDDGEGPELAKVFADACAAEVEGAAPPAWSEPVDLMARFGQASNLLAAAVASSGEVLHLTPSLCEATGLGGPAVGQSVVDLAHGDAVSARLRALARGEADPQGAFSVAFRRLSGDGTVLVALRELEAARIERLLQAFAGRHRLTAAERAALHDIARGLSAKESAQRLGLSPETVRARRKRIFRKVGADGCGSVMAQLLGSAPGRAL